VSRLDTGVHPCRPVSHEPVGIALKTRLPAVARVPPFKESPAQRARLMFAAGYMRRGAPLRPALTCALIFDPPASARDRSRLRSFMRAHVAGHLVGKIREPGFHERQIDQPGSGLKAMLPTCATPGPGIETKRLAGIRHNTSRRHFDRRPVLGSMPSPQ